MLNDYGRLPVPMVDLRGSGLTDPISGFDGERAPDCGSRNSFERTHHDPWSGDYAELDGKPSRRLGWLRQAGVLAFFGFCIFVPHKDAHASVVAIAKSLDMNSVENVTIKQSNEHANDDHSSPYIFNRRFGYFASLQFQSRHNVIGSDDIGQRLFPVFRDRRFFEGQNTS